LVEVWLFAADTASARSTGNDPPSPEALFVGRSIDVNSLIFFRDILTGTFIADMSVSESDIPSYQMSEMERPFRWQRRTAR
jgi:hypothetical protein